MRPDDSYNLNMEKEFCRVRSGRDIVLTSIIIIGGALLLALPTSDPLNILGMILITAGIILSFVLRSGYKDPQNGDLYCKSEKYFDKRYKSKLAEAIANEPDKINLCEENIGNGIRLDIYYCRKKGKAYAQLFEYIPYRYEACTEQHEYEIIKVTKLIEKQ